MSAQLQTEVSVKESKRKKITLSPTTNEYGLAQVTLTATVYHDNLTDRAVAKQSLISIQKHLALPTL